MAQKTAITDDAGPFKADVEAALQRIRSSLAAVVAAVPPKGTLVTAADIQRALSLDKKLSWRLSKVIRASEPLSVGTHVPGPSSLDNFLKSAAKKGVANKLIEEAAGAGRSFQQVVQEHAGDRTAFDSMISSLAGTSGADQIIHQQRRAVFRGQRHVFGVHTKVHIRTIIFRHSDEDPTLVDFAQLKGYVSLHRLRTDAPMVFSKAFTLHDDGSVRDTRVQPIDPTTESGPEATMLKDFCSDPLPKYRIVRPAPGVVCSELTTSGIGQKSAITCIEGHFVKHGSIRFQTDTDATCAGCAPVRVPCETLILDLLVHEDTFGPISPRVFTCAEHTGEIPAPHVAEKPLHLEPAETVAYLGKGPAVLFTPDYPRYTELGEHVFNRLGWDGNRFDVYRCHVSYPVLPSTLVMTFDLPKPPEVETQ